MNDHVITALSRLAATPQPTRVVNRRRDRYDVYIGRPSIWGNPYSHRDGTLAHTRVATVEDAIAAYEVWLLLQPGLVAKLPTLRGRILGCWCKPGLCHGDVLARLADGPLGELR